MPPDAASLGAPRLAPLLLTPPVEVEEMGTVSALVALVGWVAVEGGGVVPADGGRETPTQAGGLAGLSDALNGTGRIGNMQPQGAGVDGANTVSHGDLVVRPQRGGGEVVGGSRQPDPSGE